MRSKEAALHLSCSPPRGAWGGLPQLLTDVLPPFSVISGTLRISLAVSGDYGMASLFSQFFPASLRFNVCPWIPITSW